MIYFEIKDRDSDGVLASNLDKCTFLDLFKGFEHERKRVGDFKNIFKNYSDCTVRLLIEGEDDILNSPAIGTRTADMYAGLTHALRNIQRDQETGYKVFLHNLVTTHAKLQGEIESVISEKAIMRCDDHESQVELVRNIVGLEPANVADALLQISKRIVDLQSQIEGFKILTNETVTDLSTHNIKSALASIVYPFHDNLAANEIRIRFRIEPAEAENNLVILDYKLFNVAIHHFLNNAAKYVKPHSTIDVFFHSDQMTPEFLMTSIRIERDEIADIFKLGVSGKYAGQMAGEGIGMYMVGRSLELMGSRMDVVPDYSHQELIGNVPYVRNKFFIRLQRATR